MSKPHDLSAPKKATKSVVLEPWDWRYHVGYDVNLSNRIAKDIQRVSTREQREILESIYKWACSFISLDALITRELSEEELCQEINQTDIDKCIPLRGEDVSYYRSHISERFGSNSKLISLVETVANKTKQLPFRNLDLEFFSIIFPKRKLESWINENSDTRPTDIPAFEELSVSQMRSQVQQFINSHAASMPVNAKRFFDLSSVVIDFVKADDGYAEYWPRSLSDEGLNRLIVYDNPWVRDKLELEGTLKHELYPGHGLFYAMLEHIEPAVIDHGATVLVEGWATYAEWLEGETSYCRYTRDRAKRYIPLLQCGSEHEFTSLLQSVRETAVRPAPYDQQYRQFRQYPGFALSYILGALWFEELVGDGDPFDFLSQLIKKGAGDFFRIWSVTDSISSSAAKVRHHL